MGTTHINVGSAGFALDCEGFWKVPCSRTHEYGQGYGRVQVANSSALYFQWVQNKDKLVRDKVWLINQTNVIC